MSRYDQSLTLGQLSTGELRRGANQHFYADLPSADPEQLSGTIMRLIDLAFGQLGARHLEVRVHDITTERKDYLC